ncbi:MAG: type VI secretion system tip protein VgrG [Gammaproteobacteria bacterium]|nr:type VI secretion system tip protein VgrG [Gammaproteobacteria bacterium]
MAVAIAQETRLLSITTPLGADKLVLQSFTGTEDFSNPFTYHLSLLSEDDAIAAPDIVGQNVTFQIKQADGEPRFFNGFVRRFVGGALGIRGMRNYHAEVVPWLWFLTRASDCRIFQNQTVSDIIEQVFGDLGFSDYKLDLQGDHPEHVYRVQYRETAFNFVSRLMEEEGMFYWFDHEDGKHTLTIADHQSAYSDCQEAEIEYVAGSASGDYISSWEHQYEFRSGKYAQSDYNFETPSTNLMTQTNTVVSLPSIDKFELYDYPGDYPDKSEGEALTRLRMEEEESVHDVVRCTSTCRTLYAGGKFSVSRHECPSEEGSAYVLTSVRHSASDHTQLVDGGQAEYENSFTCIPDSVVFRPRRVTPRPEVRGPQTAVVVGPAGEEIYPDEFGRVKVQFHWDRVGKNDENSSCWIRSSTPWAGKNWGGLSIPRIGQEVIVDFLEGNIDSPIITGRVYNAEQMPPYGLPGGKAISGMKSNSTKGGGGYNEYVMDDTKGNELIREHGQFDKDSTIENDLREHVLNDRSRDVTNNEAVQIGVDRTKSVGNDQNETIGNNKSIKVGVNHDETIGSNMNIKVGSNHTATIGSNMALTIGAAMAETVASAKVQTIGGDKVITIAKDETEKVGGAKSVSVGKDETLSVGKKLSIDAGDEILIKTGKASILMKKDGTITIQGKDITVKGSGAINAKASKNVVIKGKKILEN